MEYQFSDQLFAVLSDLESTLIKKNKDYGDSFQKQFDKYGFTSALIRLSDKMERLENLTLNKQEVLVKDESIEDTVKDLAGYAILTLIAMRKDKPIQLDMFRDEELLSDSEIRAWIEHTNAK